MQLDPALVISLCVLLTLLKAPFAVSKATPDATKCQKLGLVVPNEYMLCPSDHGLRSDCCYKCTTCPPGKGTLLSEKTCMGACVPCEKGTFNDITGSRICQPCFDCEESHRTTVQSCTRYKNAVCSRCIDGYAEHSITKRCIVTDIGLPSTAIPTTKATARRSRTKATAPPTTNMKLTQAESNDGSLLRVFVYAVIGIIIIVIGIVIYVAKSNVSHGICLSSIMTKRDSTGSPRTRNSEGSQPIDLEESSPHDNVLTETASPDNRNGCETKRLLQAIPVSEPLEQVPPSENDEEPTKETSSLFVRKRDANLHTGTCINCGQTLNSRPTQATHRDEGKLTLPPRGVIAQEIGQCATCAANRQRETTRQENDDAIGGDQTPSIPTLGFDQVPQEILDGSKTKVLSDLPHNVKRNMCFLLDGNYGNIAQGRIAFARKMGIDDVQARAAITTEDILLKLQTMHKPVYDLMIALRDINRKDVLYVLSEGVRSMI